MTSSPSNRLPRLFVIGDSISIQYGPYLETLGSGLFHYDRKRDDAGTDAGRNLDNPEGANGGDSSRVLAYLRARARGGGIPADFLLLNCGLHDIKTAPETGERQIPLSQYRENLGAILDEARGMKLAPLWVRTTPVIDEIHNSRSTIRRHAADVEAYNAAADAVMARAGVPMIDLHGFSAHFLPGGLIDHVHYDPPTREKQAAFLAGALGILLRR